MRIALTALVSGASFCALTTIATAQVVAPYYGGYEGPTRPSLTGAPLYSYHNQSAQPGVVGSCQVISGNRVCFATPASAINAPGYGYGAYGYGYGGPIGAVVAAPFDAAGAVAAGTLNATGAVAAAPVAATGAVVGAPYGYGYAPTTVGYGYGYAPAYGATYAPATGTPVYSYESQVGPQPGIVGHCSMISGNRVCTMP
jgi:hypothetical protein